MFSIPLIYSVSLRKVDANRFGRLFAAILALSINSILIVDAEAVTYKYDNLHRLTSVSYDNGTTIAYTYDAAGNRLAKAYDSRIHYVSPSGSHTPPYSDWATAATNIQSAVNAASSNHTVIVGDGTYSLTSEITVSNSITVISQNGLDVTVVDGGGNGRCFNVAASNVLISGLAVINGVVTDWQSGGGVYCSDSSVIVSNCMIAGNSAHNYGGGMYKGTATHCTFSGNRSRWGGGMGWGKAINCVFTENVGSLDGGGMYGGSAYNCSFSMNSSTYGGGLRDCTAKNCTINGNFADYGGGSCGGSIYNSIVWHNTANISDANLYSTDANNSCSPGLMHGVDGNITNNPILVSSSHVASNSPCRGVGSFAYSSGTDIDGEAWLNPPSMGCDEYHGSGTVTGPLQLSLFGPTNLLIGFSGDYYLEVQGRAVGVTIDFDDDVVVTNQISLEYAWDAPGDYDVVVTAFNDDYPSGISVTQAVQVVSAEASAVYVSDPTGEDTNDGRSWATAKKTIQAGVDAQNVPSGIVWVSNGTYVISSEISVAKTVRIFSVNGPGFTIVDGGGSTRCFNLSGPDCLISGVTIINGYRPSGYGGGIFCKYDSMVISNCVISDNSSGYGGGVFHGTARHCIFKNNFVSRLGGGMLGGAAYNCSFIGNSSEEDGGGKFGGTAYNCTFSGNSARNGGGVYDGAIYNCIAWHNTADISGENFDNTYARYTCSPDLVHGADGNITNNPLLFLDYRIATNSPCRSAGSFAYTTGTDIDGEAWLNPPSMGCDEYHGPGSLTGPIQLSLNGLGVLLVDYVGEYSCSVQGRVSGVTIDFGDGTVATNQINLEHAWSNPGFYDVVLTAFNDDYPSGMSITQSVHVVSEEESSIYVSDLTGNDSNVGTNWATAKKTIQAGVDAQEIVGGIILVSNGTYSVVSEISVSKPMKILSMGGPKDTIVDGGGSNRCFNVTESDVWISGFTISNGYFHSEGGGVYCVDETVVCSNCLFVENIAGSWSGGGMQNGTAYNCVFSGNHAGYFGGGKAFGSAYNCAFVGNSSDEGGGSSDADAYNCTFVGNTAKEGGGMWGNRTAYNCVFWGNSATEENPDLRYVTAYSSCSLELTNGVDGNITNNPVLVSTTHIATNSPCRGAGDPANATGTDIDDEVWLNPPSMGCDEYHGLDTVVGPIELNISGPTNLHKGIFEEYHIDISGAVYGFNLSFGDGDIRHQYTPSFSKRWETPGEYDVVLQAFNDDYPSGVSITQSVSVVAVRLIQLVGDSKLNGDFNANPGDNVKFSGTAEWYNLGGEQTTVVATDNDTTYDDTQNAVISSSKIFGLDTGYTIARGDVFDISYLWRDAWKWVDASEQVRVSLFVTADNTLTGVRTNLVSDLSGISTVDSAYEPVDHNAIYTAIAVDVGKTLFVAIDSTTEEGFARLDNFELLVLTLDGDLDGDGLPDWWENQYFAGVTNANPTDISLNGINTVREAYIAGLDPNDPNAAFLASIQWSSPQAILGWNTASDRVYSVWWTTNLLDGFQPLETDIPWTQRSYTNTEAPPCNFYKINVQLEN